jgi:hypothetical protein
MSTPSYPRTQAIMIEVRKAVNAPNVGKAIQYLETAHDLVEELEREHIQLRDIAKKLSKLATNMDANPPGSVGEQVYALQQLEKRL